MKNNIRKLREERKKTQLEISKILNINNTSLSRMENGTHSISDDQAIALADFFNVSLDYLLGREWVSPEKVIYKTIDFDYNDILHKIKAYSKNDLQRLKGVIDFLLETRENGFHKEASEGTTIHKN